MSQRALKNSLKRSYNAFLSRPDELADKAGSTKAATNWLVQYRRQHHQDPIYGEIPLEPYQMTIAESPHFCRLRGLRQMGAAHYVFTNAHHTRFSHSIGVAHLAKRMYRHVVAQSERETYSAFEEMFVVTAAMCHDLGHGPHSHAFERYAKDFDHEEMSVRLLENAMKTGQFEFICNEPFTYERGFESDIPADDDTEDFEKADFSVCGAAVGAHSSSKQIANVPAEKHTREETIRINLAILRAMVQGVSVEDAAVLLPRHKYWLFEIVHNTKHGIDVDKMDYLMRDVHAVYGAVNANVRIEHIIQSVRIVKGHLRFHVCSCNQLYELLYLRASLYKNVYTNDSVVSVERMFLDLLHMVDDENDKCITKAIKSVDRFLLLDDSVFSAWATLRNADRNGQLWTLARRIQTHDFYSVVARRTFRQTKRPTSRVCSIDSVLTAYEQEYGCNDRSVFNADSLFVHTSRYDLGNGPNDPLKETVFYLDTQESGPIECNRDGHTSCFYENEQSTEYLVRLYCKTSLASIDDAKLKQLTRVFGRLLEAEGD